MEYLKANIHADYSPIQPRKLPTRLPEDPVYSPPWCSSCPFGFFSSAGFAAPFVGPASAGAALPSCSASWRAAPPSFPECIRNPELFFDCLHHLPFIREPIQLLAVFAQRGQLLLLLSEHLLAHLRRLVVRGVPLRHHALSLHLPFSHHPLHHSTALLRVWLALFPISRLLGSHKHSSQQHHPTDPQRNPSANLCFLITRTSSQSLCRVSRLRRGACGARYRSR